MALLLSLIAPLALLFIEKVLPFPYILEELTKFLLIKFGVVESDKKLGSEFAIAAGIGALFTVSETILYVFNMNVSNSPIIILHRLLTTGALHVGTSILIAYGIKRGKFSSGLFLLIAMIVHFSYNLLIGKFLQ